LDVYEGDGLKLTAAIDERGVENVYVQVWSRPRMELERAAAGDGVEIFIPGHQDWS
jgi:hypothetical protein